MQRVITKNEKLHPKVCFRFVEEGCDFLQKQIKNKGKL